MSKKKVCIVYGNAQYERMFINNGFDVVDSLDEADLILFTGGEDVTPSLYGEDNVGSFCNIHRDEVEVKIFDKYKGVKPFAGICRGSQFLCVMNGGKLFQDVNNHGVAKGHYLITEDTKERVLVSSTHHQMQREVIEAGGLVLAYSEARCTEKWFDGGSVQGLAEGRDIEISYFKGTNSLCFQPHPEYFPKGHECQELFFRLLNQYVFGE